jgi:hypothetical protein
LLRTALGADGHSRPLLLLQHLAPLPFSDFAYRTDRPRDTIMFLQLFRDVAKPRVSAEVSTSSLQWPGATPGRHLCRCKQLGKSKAVF